MRITQVLVLATALAAGFAGTALAGEAGVSAQSVDQSDRQQAIAYWTPERMRNAEPVDFPAPPPEPFSDSSLLGFDSVTPDRPPVAIPGSTGGDGLYAVSPDLETNPANDTTFPTRIHGKIFATLPAGNFSCSGTVASSPLANLVVTAGHCVQGQGVFATNFVFVPGYRNGNSPLGVWPSTNLFASNGWINGSGFSFDVGMARIAPVNGALIENALGARGIAFNQPAAQVFDILGYPSRPNAANPQDGFGDYNGERLIHCDDPTSQVIENLGDGPSIGAAYCFMQQGSSGGGWVIGTGNRFVNSVVSHGYCQNDPAGAKTTWDPNTQTGKCGIFFGPYFGTAAQNLYNAATTNPSPPATTMTNPSPPQVAAKKCKKKKKKGKKRKKKKCK